MTVSDLAVVLGHSYTIRKAGSPICGCPLTAMGYGVLYEYAVDTKSDQYKAPFNTIYNTARVYTPKDTAVVTPNSDTPYSVLWADRRAEPLVLSVPEVEKGRYYSVMLTDMYTCNYGYIGTRATGNGAGTYMIAGPNWKGETPEGSTRCSGAKPISRQCCIAHSCSGQATLTT